MVSSGWLLHLILAALLWLTGTQSQRSLHQDNLQAHQNPVAYEGDDGAMMWWCSHCEAKSVKGSYVIDLTRSTLMNPM